MTENKLEKRDFLLLGLIVLVGIILRIIFSINYVMGADEAVYATRAIGFLENIRISTMDQGPIWFSMTDMFFNVFGTTNLTVRLTAILASMGICILIFLYFYEFYENKNMGFLSAALFSLSNFAISQNLEMDIVMTFFMVFSIYFFIKAFRNKTSKYGFYMLLLSLFLNSIAVSIKTTAILVFPVYFVFIAFNFKNLEFLRKDILKKIFFILFVGIIPVLSILVYNYFLKIHTGFYDVIFTEFIQGISDTPYEGLAAPNFSILNIFINSWQLFIFFFKKDILLIILFILSIFAYKHIKYFSILFSIFIIEIIFMLGSSGLFKHYVNLIPIMILILGSTLYTIYNKIFAEGSSFYKRFIIFFGLLLILQILVFNTYFYQHPQSEARSFVKDNVPSDRLIISDEKIYTLFSYWIANDKNIITLFNFAKLNEFYKNSTNLVNEEVYYLKCESYDCGWGISKVQSIENYLVQTSLDKFAIDWEKIGEFKNDKFDQSYGVYKTNLNYHYEIKKDAYLTDNFYYHSLGWKNPEGSFDHYTPQGEFDKAVHYSTFSILMILTILTLISFLLPIFLLIYHSKKGLIK